MYDDFDRIVYYIINRLHQNKDLTIQGGPTISVWMTRLGQRIRMSLYALQIRLRSVELVAKEIAYLISVT